MPAFITCSIEGKTLVRSLTIKDIGLQPIEHRCNFISVISNTRFFFCSYGEDESPPQAFSLILSASTMRLPVRRELFSHNMISIENVFLLRINSR
jgi:hypothetical protein